MMEPIQCDNCDRWFRPPLESAGGKTPCPHCGDINRVPAMRSEGVATSAATSPEPGATSRHSNARSADVGQAAAPGEEELRVVRPGMFRAHPFRYALIVIMFLGALMLMMASFTTDQVGPWGAWVSLVLVLGTLTWFVWWWVTAHFWVRLVVSNKRTIKHVGIIKRHTTEVLHDHVRSVDIRQTFLERMLDVGTIGIDSAGQDGIEIEVSDIPHPYEIKKTIDKFRKM